MSIIPGNRVNELLKRDEIITELIKTDIAYGGVSETIESPKTEQAIVSSLWENFGMNGQLDKTALVKMLGKEFDNHQKKPPLPNMSREEGWIHIFSNLEAGIMRAVENDLMKEWSWSYSGAYLEVARFMSSLERVIRDLEATDGAFIFTTCDGQIDDQEIQSLLTARAEKHLKLLESHIKYTK